MGAFTKHRRQKFLRESRKMEVFIVVPKGFDRLFSSPLEL